MTHTGNVIELRTGTHHALPDGYVNGVQLAHQAGVTYRQVDYWTRVGYLHPIHETPGSGSQRVYPTSEVAFALLMGDLVNDGLLPQTAAPRARELLDTGTTHIAGMPVHLPQDL